MVIFCFLWLTNGNCEQFTSQGADICSSYSGCEWTYSWGGWVTGGSSDCLGTYEVDNGYCDELEITSGCIDDSYGILESYSYQCNDIVGSWFSWGCDDDLSVAIPGAPSGMWTIGDLCPQSCNECDEENVIIEELFNNKKLLKTIDFLGREINSNTEFRLEIFDDGSIEKTYIIK